jgi:hypothetical protein
MGRRYTVGSVRARRDQFVLGAAAAALLVAIVVFAASSGVKRGPAEPTAAPTPSSERPLFGGSLEPGVRYQTRAFTPPLSFVVGDTEWIVNDATQPDILVLERRVRTNRSGSEIPARSFVTFWRVNVVSDAASVHDLLRRNPDLRVGPATPARAAGLEGEKFRVTVSFTRPARPSAACRPLMIRCTRVLPDRFFPDGVRMRTLELPMASGGPLVIDLLGLTQRDLEKLEVPAAEVLRTLRIGD